MTELYPLPGESVGSLDQLTWGLNGSALMFSPLGTNAGFQEQTEHFALQKWPVATQNRPSPPLRRAQAQGKRRPACQVSVSLQVTGQASKLLNKISCILLPRHTCFRNNLEGQVQMRMLEVLRALHRN